MCIVCFFLLGLAVFFSFFFEITLLEFECVCKTALYNTIYVLSLCFRRICLTDIYCIFFGCDANTYMWRMSQCFSISFAIWRHSWTNSTHTIDLPRLNFAVQRENLVNGHTFSGANFISLIESRGQNQCNIFRIRAIEW